MNSKISNGERGAYYALEEPMTEAAWELEAQWIGYKSASKADFKIFQGWSLSGSRESAYWPS